MSQASGATGASLRVLIVEVDTLVEMGIESQILRLGHQLVGRAATAQEALQLFRQHQPDLVLMDIKLDQGDGIELAKQLLVERRVAIIIVSAYSDADLIARAGDAGVFGYLIKPVTPEVLEAQMHVAIKRFIEFEKLLAENDALTQALETRKLADRAKGILMKRLNLSEPEAHKRLQEESQKRRVSLADISRKIMESEELLGGSQ